MFIVFSSGKMMLSAGAAVDTAGKDGSTALIRAAQNGHSQIVKVNSRCESVATATQSVLDNVSGTVTFGLLYF